MYILHPSSHTDVILSTSRHLDTKKEQKKCVTCALS